MTLAKGSVKDLIYEQFTYTLKDGELRRVLDPTEASPKPCNEIFLTPLESMDSNDPFTKALERSLGIDVASKIEMAVTNDRGYHDSRKPYVRPIFPDGNIRNHDVGMNPVISSDTSVVPIESAVYPIDFGRIRSRGRPGVVPSGVIGSSNSREFLGTFVQVGSYVNKGPFIR